MSNLVVNDRLISRFFGSDSDSDSDEEISSLNELPASPQVAVGNASPLRNVLDEMIHQIVIGRFVSSDEYETIHEDNDPVLFHNQSFQELEWLDDKKIHAISFPRRIIHIKHLTTICDGRGYHFCRTNVEEQNMRASSNTFVAANGVFQATFSIGDNATKTSTFFPRAIVGETEAALLHRIRVLDERGAFARNGNRLLYRDFGFLVEMFVRGPLVKSAFPIFFYYNFQEMQGLDNDVVRIADRPDIQRTRRELLDIVQDIFIDYHWGNDPEDILSAQDTVRFRVGNGEWIFDIASRINVGIQQGIYVQISENEIFA